MPKNKVQFQQRMSLSEFMQAYATLERCELGLFAWCSPQGLVCPSWRGCKPINLGIRSV